MTAPLDLTDYEAAICATYREDTHVREAYQKLSDARAALRKIADGNPAPVGKWLSDVEMADIARRALLSSTTAPVAVPATREQRLESLGFEEVSREQRKANLGFGAPPHMPAPDPVQAAYAQCARIAKEHTNACVERAARHAAQSIADKIESAAARARGGK